MQRCPHCDQPIEPASLLTSRQLAVLDCLMRGMSTGQIARTLSVAEVTVRNHLNRIRTIVGVDSRTDLVVEVRRRGWVTW